MNRQHFCKGVIEGFYGTPWSHSQRLDLLKKMAHWELNTYIYAPKFDLLHRLKWADKYPNDTLEAFRELVDTGNAHGVDVVFTISPGLSIDADNPTHRDALIEKFRDFTAIGAEHLGLLLDDIPFDRANPMDHVRLMNEVMENVPGAAQWYFCPTAYSGWHFKVWDKAEDYLTHLGRGLDPTVAVFWTGNTVISQTITATDLETPSRLLQRPVTLWDNYTADDYTPAHSFFPGPIQGRDVNLTDNCRGLLLNPAERYHLSLVSIASLGAFCRDPEAYIPENAWAQYLESQFPGQGARLERILGYFYSPAGESPRWHRFIESVENWFRNPAQDDSAIRDELDTTLFILSDDDNLHRFGAFWMELYPHVSTLRGDLDYLRSGMNRAKGGETDIHRLFPLRERRWSTPVVQMVRKLVQDQSQPTNREESP